MNNLVYYRKYRPHEFDEVIGQDSTIRILKNAILKKRLAHAYLFSGPRGTGKTTVARILAHEIGCFDEDIIEIDAASSRGIDEARSLRESIRTVPFRSLYKVYIIDEVHMLTKEAFNALLKTLEEPPQHVIFVLATTELQKVPDTIISRTQHFEFHKISIHDIVSELTKICKKETINIENDAMKLIAFFADGSLRDAENILFQIVTFSEKNIKETDVRMLLGAPEEESVNKITRFALKQNVSEMLKILDNVLESGAEPNLLGKLLLRNFRAIYFLTLDLKTEEILENEFSEDEIQFFKSITQDRKLCGFAVEQVLTALNTFSDDATSHMPLELALIKTATFGNK